MNRLFSMAALCATVFCSSANAAQVALLTPVTYDPGASVPEKVREECRLDYQLQSDISNALVRRYKGGSGTTTSTQGQVLRVTITYVLGPAAGSFSGPKSMSILAELLNDGKVQRSTKMRRTSVSMNIFKGTCAILDKPAHALAKDVVKWFEDPGYSPTQEGEPAQDAASDAAK